MVRSASEINKGCAAVHHCGEGAAQLYTGLSKDGAVKTSCVNLEQYGGLLRSGSNVSQSPAHYATSLLKRFGITDLVSLNSVFSRDPGRELAVRPPCDGGGVAFTLLEPDTSFSGGWMLVEEGSADNDRRGWRARVFKALEGAVAEFAIRLRLHAEGQVTITEEWPDRGLQGLRFTAHGRTISLVAFEQVVRGLPSTC